MFVMQVRSDRIRSPALNLRGLAAPPLAALEDGYPRRLRDALCENGETVIEGAADVRPGAGEEDKVLPL